MNKLIALIGVGTALISSYINGCATLTRNSRPTIELVYTNSNPELKICDKDGIVSISGYAVFDKGSLNFEGLYRPSKNCVDVKLVLGIDMGKLKETETIVIDSQGNRA